MTDKRIIDAKTAFAVCFLALMTLLGMSSVYAYIKNHLAVEQPKTVICADVPVVNSFKEIYPFDGAAAIERPKILSAYLNTANGLKCAVNNYSTRLNSLSKPFYRLSQTLDEIIGNIVIENGSTPIVRLSNGYYTFIYSDNDSYLSETLRDWADWLKERDIPLLQLIPATKTDDRIPGFFPRIFHGYAQMIEQYKDFLAKKQIPCIDAKEILLTENEDFYSWFYKTDHHWNVFAGRTIAEAVARILNDEFDIKTDANKVKEENFSLTRYPSIFRGSMAYKAGTAPEDFDVFYLREESSFHLKILCIGIDRTGGFNDTLIAQHYLQSNTYATFLYGDKPLTQVENQTCTNGTKVLVIKYSQADVVCPYLACAVEYLDVIDPRYFDGNIKAYIEQTKPDVVLICI